MAEVCNKYLESLEPWQILFLGTTIAFVVLRMARFCRRLYRHLQDKGISHVCAAFLLDLPVIRRRVAEEQSKSISKLRTTLKKSKDGEVRDTLTTLPVEGVAASQVKAQMVRKSQADVRFAEGASKVSGAVYLSGSAHQLLLNDVYKQFSLANPMHSDIFPSVRKMEAEVVAMTASFLGGGPAGDPRVCGAMTSGGTESILTAVKASRDYMAAVKGIREPEMIIADSAHAAFIKAAEYFKIRVIRVPVGRDYRLSGRTVARAISKNTVLVVASAPGFPHGVMDHVEEIAAVARQKGILCHVDCCLGGFVLPFAREIGYPIPPFDFSVPGVTSMSVDTHKFGQAHKGTSVVLYRNPSIRQHQYTSITEWSGGLYISPGFAGSRSGALIATAWAAMIHLGREGYRASAKHLLTLSKQFITGIEGIEGIEVMGKPEMSVVAFKSNHKGLNIYKLNDLLSARGWHLNALQRPPALHMCFTAAHSENTVAELLRDIGECVSGLLAHPGTGDSDEGMAPLYGMAATVPDRRIVGNFLVAYQDILLEAQ